MIVDDLTMEKCLGTGAYGEVYLTRKKGSSQKFATKRIDKKIANSEKYQKYFKNEREILNELNHENIVKLFEIKQNSKYYFLVKEYCNGGSLKDCLDKYIEEYDKPFPQEIIQHIVKQIIEVLKYLHSINIIHRNLKLQNILVIFETEKDKERLNMLKAKIKINDFFFATHKTSSSHQTVVGSPYYMDPIILELLKVKGSQSPNLGYDEKADIWSLGSICYEMLTGKTMFNSDSMEGLFKEAEKGNYSLPFNISKEIVSFINGMLQYDSDERLSADELSKQPFLIKNVQNFERMNIKNIREKIDKNGLNVNFKNNENNKDIFKSSNTINNEINDNDNNKEEFKVEENNDLNNNIFNSNIDLNEKNNNNDSRLKESEPKSKYSIKSSHYSQYEFVDSEDYAKKINNNENNNNNFNNNIENNQINNNPSYNSNANNNNNDDNNYNNNQNNYLNNQTPNNSMNDCNNNMNNYNNNNMSN